MGWSSCILPGSDDLCKTRTQDLLKEGVSPRQRWDVRAKALEDTVVECSRYLEVYSVFEETKRIALRRSESRGEHSSG